MVNYWDPKEEGTCYHSQGRGFLDTVLFTIPFLDFQNGYCTICYIKKTKRHPFILRPRVRDEHGQMEVSHEGSEVEGRWGEGTLIQKSSEVTCPE